MDKRTQAFTSVILGPPEIALIEQASAAIARLDARFSATLVATPWRLRAAWSGYASALQLQGHEIDEIDVFAWGCGLSLPGRARLATLEDPFAAFSRWHAQFAGNAGRHWREDLGSLVSPGSDDTGAKLVRAIESLRQISVGERSIDAWLALPLLLQRLGVTHSLLPILVAGERRLRLGQAADAAVLRRLLKALAERATIGLARLDAIEGDRLRAARAIMMTARPGALARLVARLQIKPIASPQAIAREFRLTISGAGKLLARAASAGLVREVRGTQAWKLYLVPDLAVALGLAPAPRGRPRSEPPALPSEHGLAAVLAAFDADMAAFDRVQNPRPAPLTPG